MFSSGIWVGAHSCLWIKQLRHRHASQGESGIRLARKRFRRSHRTVSPIGEKNKKQQNIPRVYLEGSEVSARETNSPSCWEVDDAFFCAPESILKRYTSAVPDSGTSDSLPSLFSSLFWAEVINESELSFGCRRLYVRLADSHQELPRA